jgi:hypothetical protein
MMPAMYWQTPPKNIMVVMMMLGASTPRVPMPVIDTRKTLVAKASRPSGAGLPRRRWYTGIPGWLLSLVSWASRRAEVRMSSFSEDEDMLGFNVGYKMLGLRCWTTITASYSLKQHWSKVKKREMEIQSKWMFK